MAAKYCSMCGEIPMELGSVGSIIVLFAGDLCAHSAVSTLSTPLCVYVVDMNYYCLK